MVFFRADGAFVVLPAIPVKLLERGCRIAVLKLLVAEGAIGERLLASMLAWRHSGFSVHNGVRVPTGDIECRMLRAPLSETDATSSIGLTFHGNLPLTRSHCAPPGGAQRSEIKHRPIVRGSRQVQAPDCGVPAVH
jgi:hypothetical protein